MDHLSSVFNFYSPCVLYYESLRLGIALWGQVNVESPSNGLIPRCFAILGVISVKI